MMDLQLLTYCLITIINACKYSRPCMRWKENIGSSFLLIKEIGVTWFTTRRHPWEMSIGKCLCKVCRCLINSSYRCWTETSLGTGIHALYNIWPTIVTRHCTIKLSPICNIQNVYFFAMGMIGLFVMAFMNVFSVKPNGLYFEQGYMKHMREKCPLSIIYG